MLTLLASLPLLPALLAQQQFTPHAAYVYPAGGRQGSEIEVIVGGQFLTGASTAIVSGAGVQATVVEHLKPPTQAQVNDFREKLRGLTEKRVAAAKQQKTQPGSAVLPAEDEKALAEIARQIGAFARGRTNPALSETLRLRVNIAPGATPGERELRVATPNALTNPLVFCVGELPEFSRQPATIAKDPMATLAAIYQAQPRASKSEPPVGITLPATVNGQIMPAGVDRYRFRASIGQRLVIAASAQALIPYISDAVPGWFQAALALYDANGKELAHAGNYRFHPDPVLYYEIPADGEYVLAIRDSIYRGREDFVYRISIGELPFITNIFPLGGKAGGRTKLEVKGWNLPAAKVSVRDSRTGVHPVTVKGPWVSNRVPFAVDALPERVEKEANNDLKTAQEVKLPVIVNGRIGAPRDRDVFRFKGRAGDEIVAEVFARRLDSPLDSMLRLTDASGRELAANDDYEDAASGLLTHHADSRINFKLPANGTYYVHVADVEQRGGAEYAYRLRISRPQPDFELRVAPSSLSARGGMTAPLTVYALRKDGFAGDISLSLKNAPAGFVLSGWIPANQDKARVTLTSPAKLGGQTFEFALEGRATVGGRTIIRTAVPAEDRVQAFAYHHLVPADEWRVHVAKGGPATQAWRVDAGKPLKLPAGGTAPLRVFVPAARASQQLRLKLSEPPEGIAIQRATPTREGVDIVLRADASKAKPGLQGNLIVEVSMERPANAASGTPRPGQRVPLGTLPAIPFEIVGP